MMNKEINNRNFKGLISYIHKHYGDEGVDLLTGGLIKNEKFLIADKYDPSLITPVQLHHLVDDSYWVSNEFSLQLLANVKKVVPGENPLFDAGQNTVTEIFSKSHLFAVKIFHFKTVLSKAHKINSQFNKTKDVILTSLTNNSATLELRYKPEYRVTKDVCNWNLGIYYGLLKINGLSNARIKETSCFVEGDKCCTFKLDWKNESFAKRLFKFFVRPLTQDLIDDFDYTVGERNKLIDCLSQSEARYRSLTDNSLTGIYILENELINYVNDRMAQLLNYPPTELIGKKLEDLAHPDYRDLVREKCKAISAGDQASFNFEFCFLKKNGEITWLEVLSTSIEYNNKRLLMGNVLDVTERKLSEDALRNNEAKLRFITNNTLDIITQTDAEGIIQYVSSSSRTLLGRKPEDLVGRSVFEFIHPEDLNRVINYFKSNINNALKGRLEYRYKHTDGHYLWLETVGTLILGNSAKVAGTILSSRDITERKQVEEQIKYLSLHDHLTGLYNRTYFEGEIRRLEKAHSETIGIIICDVDGLKLINDTMGHKTGDEFLQWTATIISKCFRKEDVVARIGGDEFAILLSNCNKSDIEGYCQRIQDTVNKHNNENPKYHLSISVGFAFGNVLDNSVSDLYKKADNVMCREKLYRSQSTRSAIVQTLMKALEARDFITEGHADRLQGLVTGLAVAIGLPEHKITDLRLLAQFHDIGKVGIPDRILFKPGPLNSEEYMEMQRHCEIGHRIALSSPDLVPIADWILKHHESWDGKGYPFGLKGKEIPLECRILAIADAYDAMTSDRPYRKAMSHEDATAELVNCCGTQFDPELVHVFIRCQIKPVAIQVCDL